VQIVFTVPASLIGQPIANVLDAGRAGAPLPAELRFGSSITLPSGYLNQAILAGLTMVEHIPG
jgi:hypothetical protein